MRNIFDQYKHSENRLTHALASSLAQDRKLLKAFCIKFGSTSMDMSHAYILEQSAPWLIDVSEAEAEQKGLPDALIYNEEGNAVVIESKIGSSLTNDQLLRHSRTLFKHGFKKLSGIAITVGKYENLPDGWTNILWVDVYKFLKGHSGFWPNAATEYFEALEESMVAEETLLNGSLTSFAGIRFDESNQYNYLEAKRVLKLLMAEIKKDKAAVKELNIDASFKGRNISKQEGVWDYLPFSHMKFGPEFTNSPHMTAGLRPLHADAHITFPNNLRGLLQNKIKALSLEEFSSHIESVARFYEKSFGQDAGIKPMIKIVQRHYKTQRSKPDLDAELIADLRTIYKSNSKVKFQPEWLAATHNLLINKKSNLQFQLGCQFDYSTCKSIKNESAHELFVDSWRGAKKFIDGLIGG